MDRQQMATGLLEQDTIVRRGVLVPVEGARELRRLRAEQKALLAKLEKAKRKTASQERTIEILGKAVEFMRDAPAGRDEDSGTDGTGRL